jgi:hypothetical protein
MAKCHLYGKNQQSFEISKLRKNKNMPIIGFSKGKFMCYGFAKIGEMGDFLCRGCDFFS